LCFSFSSFSFHSSLFARRSFGAGSAQMLMAAPPRRLNVTPTNNSSNKLPRQELRHHLAMELPLLPPLLLLLLLFRLHLP